MLWKKFTQSKSEIDNNEQELHSAVNTNSKVIPGIVIYLFTYFM